MTVTAILKTSKSVKNVTSIAPEINTPHRVLVMTTIQQHQTKTLLHLSFENVCQIQDSGKSVLTVMAAGAKASEKGPIDAAGANARKPPESPYAIMGIT